MKLWPKSVTNQIFQRLNHLNSILVKPITKTISSVAASVSTSQDRVSNLQTETEPTKNQEFSISAIAQSACGMIPFCANILG